MKDFKKIMSDLRMWSAAKWNAGESKYTFSNGSYIEFFSVQDEGKVRGPRRHDLYVNEANRVPWDTFHQLSIRSSGAILIDFNPSNKFWYHTEIVGSNNWSEQILTYRDNEALSPILVEEIEKSLIKGFHNPNGDIHDPLNIKSEYWANWWKVYGLGMLGSLEGVIFQNITHIDRLPVGGTRAIGIDWGYTHDPTSAIDLRLLNGKLYRRQIFHRQLFPGGELSEKGFKILVNGLLQKGVDEKVPVVVDNDKLAALKLEREGFNVYLADKSAGSVMAGIQAMQDTWIHTTYDSVETIKEEGLYMWEFKDGKPIDRPIDAYNHSWDATRYAFDYLIDPSKKHYQDQKKKKKGTRKAWSA
jgi:phage terminase large subunit